MLLVQALWSFVENTQQNHGGREEVPRKHFHKYCLESKMDSLLGKVVLFLEKRELDHPCDPTNLLDYENILYICTVVNL